MKSISARRSWLLAATMSALLVPAAALGQEQEHQHEPDVSVRTDDSADVSVGVDQPSSQAQPRQQQRTRAQQQIRQQDQLAQGGQGACPQQEALGRRIGTLREASGEILRTKVVAIRGTNQQNLVALIDTRRGNDRLVVDLGPVDAVRSMQLQRGDRISVEGRVHRVGDRQILVATRIREGDRTASIDRSGQAQHHARMQQQLQHQRAGTDQLSLQERELEARSTPGLFQEPGELEDDDDFSDAQARVDVEVDDEPLID